MFAVAHDLRAARTGDAAFFRIHGAFLDDVVGRVRIGERAAAESDHGGFAELQRGGRRIREELAEPCVARADDRQVRIGLLDFSDDVDESRDALERMLRGVGGADDRCIERPPVIRFVVGICDGQIDDRDADFL